MDVTPYEHEGNTYTRLSVSVGYQKGNGFYVTLHPVLKDGCEVYDFSRNPLSDTTWVDVESAPRNNVTRLTLLYDNLLAGELAIRELFDKRDWEQLKATVKAVALGETSTTTSSTTNQNSTMATTIKAADLIGKTIKAGETCKYVVKSVEGDKLTTEFTFGSHKPMTCPIPLSQVQKMVDEGKWSISGQGDEVQGAKTEPEKPTSEVQGDEVQGTKTEPEKPKAKTEPKAKPKKTKQEVKGNYTYATYTNKKGKKCAKIVGVTETEEAYTHAAELHASGSFERDKQGNKQFYLCFGPRYADAAKAVCDAMNAGKSLADCKAIIDKQTADNAQKREEWKAKRAERANGNSNGYTVEQVAAMLHAVMNGGELPDDIKAAMKRAA